MRSSRPEAASGGRYTEGDMSLGVQHRWLCGKSAWMCILCVGHETGSCSAWGLNCFLSKNTASFLITLGFFSFAPGAIPEKIPVKKYYYFFSSEKNRGSNEILCIKRAFSYSTTLAEFIRVKFLAWYLTDNFSA